SLYKYLNKYIHRTPANHSFLARLVGGEREVVQPRFTGAQGRFRLRPDLGFDATAAHRSRDFSVLKEQHFCTTLLRSRATRVRDGGHNHTLAAVFSLIDQSIQVALRNGGHGTLYFLVRVCCGRVYVTATKVQSMTLLAQFHLR